MVKHSPETGSIVSSSLTSGDKQGMVECSKIPDTKPSRVVKIHGFFYWSHSVVVSTGGFQSLSVGSNPAGIKRVGSPYKIWTGGSQISPLK